MSRSGAAPEADSAETAEPQPWRPPEREAFEQRLRTALAGAENEEYRINLGIQCWLFMCRVWQRRQKAAQGRSLWNPIRYAGAVIPVVAAGAGGSLVGHVHGTAGTVIGWVALLGGLAGAAINAMRPGVEHSVDLAKAAAFEQLYWDVFTYAMVNLRTDTPEDVGAALRRFAERMEEIALLSGRTTATGS
jgi:hypothetical protein